MSDCSSLKRPVRGSNIVLIGMPGAGKTTLGRLLAERRQWNFVDTDRLIERSQNRSLQEIVDRSGYRALRDIEAAVVAGLDCRQTVIATGGSVAYSEPAMCHLRAQGTILFLDVPLIELCARVHDYETRGIARRPGQSFSELFAERRNLYQRYADRVLDCAHKTADETFAMLCACVEAAVSAE